MLYHYYSRRFPFDWLNIWGALSVIRMSFVNDRDLKDQTIQAKVPFLSVLVVFCQSFPFLLFFYFCFVCVLVLFFLLSDFFVRFVTCIISFGDLLSFSNALRRGRKRISVSYFSPPPPFVVVVFFPAITSIPPRLYPIFRAAGI